MPVVSLRCLPVYQFIVHLFPPHRLTTCLSCLCLFVQSVDRFMPQFPVRLVCLFVSLLYCMPTLPVWSTSASALLCLLKCCPRASHIVCYVCLPVSAPSTASSGPSPTGPVALTHLSVVSLFRLDDPSWFCLVNLFDYPCSHAAFLPSPPVNLCLLPQLSIYYLLGK